MLDNPIKNFDRLGDSVINKQDLAIANGLINDLSSTNKDLQSQADGLNKNIQKAEGKNNEKKVNRLTSKLNDINARIGVNNQSIDRVNAILNDKTLGYTFNQLSPDATVGGTELKTMSVNGKDQNVIVMNILSGDGNAIHELTHAYQGGIEHSIQFNLNNSQYPVSFRGVGGSTIMRTFTASMVNANSEKQAYQAQYSLTGQLPSSTVGGTPNNIFSISYPYIGGLQNPTTKAWVYPIIKALTTNW